MRRRADPGVTKHSIGMILVVDRMETATQLEIGNVQIRRTDGSEAPDTQAIEHPRPRPAALVRGAAARHRHEWVKKAEVDSGKRADVPAEVADKVKALEREIRELRQANEILRKASAYFAQAELDRPFRR